MTRDRHVGLMFAIGLLLMASATTRANNEMLEDEATSGLLKTHSRAPYVHRLTLYDHDGTAIDPTDDFAGPYSPRMTCGKCHPYAVISQGWHFNASIPHAPAGRPGEPWFLIDEEVGTQVPVSGRGWRGTYAPDVVELDHWAMVKQFGRHMPGGGYGEPDDEAVRASDKVIRWFISGKLEIDCMFCHSAGQQHDPAVAAQQIEVENFKWAPTAALGLAVVRGEASKAPDDWDPLMPPDPDFPERSGPRMEWDLTRFDPDGRVFFDITSRPPNERCYYCHTTQQVGMGAAHPLAPDQDVHLAAGLLCVDCHRNGLDHRIVRGYASEAVERNDPDLAAYSCAGCHLGVPGADDPEVVFGGHYGAPRPAHRGLPPVHFEKMHCTACHAGPVPKSNMRRFRTALGHGLGLMEREWPNSAAPLIAGPLFVPLADGRIAPQHMARIAGEVPPPDPAPLPNDEYTEAPAYVWALGHNVRPVSQSWGINGCIECHVQGYIDYGKPRSTDGLVPAAAKTMAELRGDDLALLAAWDFGFGFRSTFKWYAFACAAIVGLVIVRRVGDVLVPARAAISGDVDTAADENASRSSVIGIVCWVLAAVGFIWQAFTGFGPNWTAGAVSGWPLFLHMLGAGVFILGLTAVVLVAPLRWRADGKTSTGSRVIFWITVVLAFCTMMTMLVAMLPLVGHGGQELLVDLHEYSALASLVAVVVLIGAALNERKARR